MRTQKSSFMLMWTITARCFEQLIINVLSDLKVVFICVWLSLKELNLPILNASIFPKSLTSYFIGWHFHGKSNEQQNIFFC